LWNLKAGFLEVKINNKDNGNDLDAVLTVQLAPEDYEDQIQEKLKEYRKQVNMPGFRKGKVPLNLVRKMAEAEIKKEKIPEIINKSVQDYLENNNVDLILNPLDKYADKEIDWKNTTEFEFTYDVGLKPKLNIDYEKLKELPIKKVKITDEMIEEEIENLRYNKGTVDQVEEIIDEENVSFYLKVVELDENKEFLEGGFENEKHHRINEVPESLKSELLGRKAADTFTLNLKEHFEDNEKLATFLDSDQLTVKDLNEEFQVTITATYQLQEAELNQAFFDEVFGEGEVNSEEELRDSIKKAIENYYLNQAEKYLFSEIRKKILYELDINLPEEFLQKWFKRVNDEKSEEEKQQQQDEETEYERFKEDMKWMMVIDHFADQYSVEVTSQEVLDQTKGMLRQELRRMGMPDIDDSQVEQYAQQHLQEQNNYQRTYYTLRESKVFDQLKQNVEFPDEEIDKNKFEELINEMNNEQQPQQ